MTSINIITLIIFMSLLILFIEMKTFKKILTPSIVLMLPLLIALFMNIFFASSLGYRVIGIKTIFFVLVNVLVFFLVGQIINFIFTKGNSVKLEHVFVQNYTYLYRVCFVIALLSIILSSFKLLKFILSYGFGQVSSMEFSTWYSTGVVAHIRVVSYFTFFYLIYDWTVTKRKRNIIVLLSYFGLMVIYEVKYPLIWLLLGTIYLLYLESKIKVNIRKVLTLIISLFVMFSTVYIISIGFQVGFKKVLSYSFLQFLVRHFYFYLTSSTLGLDVLLENQLLMAYDIRYFFMIPYNIWAKLSGQDYVNIIHHWVDISYDRSTNVYTMFGSIYMNLGYLGTFLGTILISMFSYVFYLISMKSKNIYIKILNSVNMSILTTSFFGFYYNMILVWESFFVLAIMAALSKIVSKKTKIKSRIISNMLSL